MTSAVTNLAGKLLIAMPSIRDGNFDRSVVFLCAHSEQGAMGFVINKPAPLTLFSDLIDKTELLDSIDEVPEDVLRMPVRLGGPVETFRGFVLHSPDYPTDQTSLKVGQGYVVSATLDVLRDIATGQGPQQRLIALGYVGWSPGQLENEILHNGWLHCEADADIIFAADLERKHAQALAKLGVDPRMLSSEAGHG
ncbi:MAG: YqgE/AlgH family protein [Phyllobacteriaceae bacterium]|nr:YqgE/AlgH family protein [Phyllobacteriaceae bacterium]